MFPSTDSMDQQTTLPAVRLRKPTVSDAAAIWRLVDRCPVLDENSCYAYLLLCSDFRDTCLVAEIDAALAGFVVGYVPPNRPDALFIWQIGVAPDARGQGIGVLLLERLLDSEQGRRARYLEATVTPGNQASARLFRAVADRLGCRLTRASHFAAGLFAGRSHDEELLIRIGPITPHEE